MQLERPATPVEAQEAKRLPWERGPGGFEAYPNGRDHPDQSATLRPAISPTGSWTWAIRHGLASTPGIASSSQAASDAANDAWPKAILHDLELRAKTQHDAELLAAIERVTVEADPDVAAIFSISAADKQTLSWLMDQVRHRTRTPGLNKLIDALSRELYKFRTGERQ